jgi:hypothetical protein
MNDELDMIAQNICEVCEGSGESHDEGLGSKIRDLVIEGKHSPTEIGLIAVRAVELLVYVEEWAKGYTRPA